MNTNETTYQNLTEMEEEALEALRENAEGEVENGWAMVYLDNAFPYSCLEVKQWRAVLGSLAKKGLYRQEDGWAWGSVMVA